MRHPRKVRVAGGRRAKAPSLILPQRLAVPIGNVEWRVGEDEIKAFIREGVAGQRALLIPAQITKDTANGKVHASKAEGCVVALLPVDSDVINTALMGGNEFLGLHKEPTGAAAGVIDTA